MKARPRQVENKIAELLNFYFSDLPIEPFERIPVLGRTGPDLTVNELGIAVDVKSRLHCPKGAFEWGEDVDGLVVHRPDNYWDKEAPRMLYIKRLSDIGMNKNTYKIFPHSKLIYDYFVHMKAWTDEQPEDLIPVIVLHRPGMLYSNSIVIFEKQRPILNAIERIRND